MWKPPLLILTIGLAVTASLGACPTGEARQELERRILTDFQVEPSKLDYVQFIDAPQRGAPCLVLISTTEEGSYHAAGGTISIAEITPDGAGKWQPGLRQRAVLQMGSFGRAPQGRLMRLGTARAAVAFDLEGMQHGYISKSVVLVVKLGNRYTEVVAIGTHHDNSATGEEGADWSWDGKVEVVQRRESDFPDLRVIYSGTELRDGKIAPVDREELWRFGEREYLLHSARGTPR